MPKQTQKGFSLLEVVVSVVLLAIISSVIAPRFIDLLPPFKYKSALGERGHVESALTLYRSNTALGSNANAISSPTLGTLISQNGWIDNTAHSGVCGGSGYVIPTFKDEDATQPTQQLSDVVMSTGLPVIDPTCPGGAQIGSSGGAPSGPNINVLATVPRGWRSNTEPPVAIAPVFDPEMLPEYFVSTFVGHPYKAFVFGLPDNTGSVYNGIMNQTNDYYNYFRITQPKNTFLTPYVNTNFIDPVATVLSDNTPQQLDTFCSINGYHSWAQFGQNFNEGYCFVSQEKNSLAYVSPYTYLQSTGDQVVNYDHCPNGYVLDGGRLYSAVGDYNVVYTYLSCRLVDRSAYVPEKTDYRCPKGYRDSQFDGYTLAGNENSLPYTFNSDITAPHCKLNRPTEVKCPTGYVSRNGGCYLP